MLLLAGGAGLVWAGRAAVSSLRRQKKAKEHERTFVGQVEARLASCREQEARFQQEAADIRDRMSSLRAMLEGRQQLMEEDRARAQVLLRDFSAEFDLRHAKAQFFGACIIRLEALLDRQQLYQRMEEDKRLLEKLRSSNFDDEAHIEETRYQLEQDTIQLSTIMELSQNVFRSDRADQAQALRRQLEKLKDTL